MQLRLPFECLPTRGRTKLFFAGLNTTLFAVSLEMRDVLVSYADVLRRPGIWSQRIWPRLWAGWYRSAMLDSGAFTELTTPGFHVDLGAYADFCLEHGALFECVVNLDDIRGDVQRSNANWEYLERRGVRTMPVYHQGEPWSQLDWCVEHGGGLIGVGFQRPITGAKQFLDEFFRRLDGRSLVHGFAMTRYALVDGYPFDQTDSTTWIAEVRSLREAYRELESIEHLKSGIRGEAGRQLASLSNSGIIQLVCDTYESSAIPWWGMSSMGGVEDWTWLRPTAHSLQRALRDEMTGQAKTVVSRVHVDHLAHALWQARARTLKEER